MQFSLDNLFLENLNGILFSIMGMSIVFFGLAVICLYVIYLPHILNFFSRLKVNYRKSRAHKEEKERQLERQKRREQFAPTLGNSQTDILLAIAAAYHLEESIMTDDQKITWKYNTQVNLNWKMSGAMRDYKIL